MFRDALITVIIPAYNESELIAATLRAVPPCVDHVLVVDDGSDDDTAGRARSVGDPRVTVVRHPRNAGVGVALRTGYEHAFAAGAEVVVVMAGDGQMDPADLPALLGPVVAGTVDYAKGNRLAHPEVTRRMPLARLVGNRVLSLLTRFATGLPVHDSQCGYTALHRRIGERVPWHALWCGYGYPNDLLGKLRECGARVCDVTVRPIYGDEKSGVRLRHAVLVVPYVLLRVAARRAAACLGAQWLGWLAGRTSTPARPAAPTRIEPRLAIEAEEREVQPNA